MVKQYIETVSTGYKEGLNFIFEKMQFFFMILVADPWFLEGDLTSGTGIFFSYSSQCETSEMRVSIERPRKKQIIMRIRPIMRIRFPPWTRRLILSGSCPSTSRTFF